MAQSRCSINTNIFLLVLLRSPRRKKKTYYLNITSVMLAMVLITTSFSLELVNRILSSQTSFVGSSDGRQDLLLRNSFFLQVGGNNSLVLERICGTTHLLSHTKDTIGRLGKATSVGIPLMFTLDSRLGKVFSIFVTLFPSIYFTSGEWNNTKETLPGLFHLQQ